MNKNRKVSHLSKIKDSLSGTQLAERVNGEKIIAEMVDGLLTTNQMYEGKRKSSCSIVFYS